MRNADFAGRLFRETLFWNAYIVERYFIKRPFCGTVILQNAYFPEGSLRYVFAERLFCGMLFFRTLSFCGTLNFRNAFCGKLILRIAYFAERYVFTTFFIIFFCERFFKNIIFAEPLYCGTLIFRNSFAKRFYGTLLWNAFAERFCGTLLQNAFAERFFGTLSRLDVRYGGFIWSRRYAAKGKKGTTGRRAHQWGPFVRPLHVLFNSH